MLCAQEHSLLETWMEHHIVVEYLNEHHVKILMFCDVEVNDSSKEALKQRYCEIHNLDVFPASFAQKPPAPAAPCRLCLATAAPPPAVLSRSAQPMPAPQGSAA